jgi:transcriptional regulator with XRE-family HTH domain
MFKNKNNTSNNLCGKNVKNFRQSQSPHLSQRGLADKLQLEGIDVDKNAIQRIESGERFVTDIELSALSKVLAVSLEELLTIP